MLRALRLKVLPSRANWGVLSWERFWEVFRFSRDLFLLGLAAQLISASQLVLVSRLISLDAAAVWSVCMKSFAMAQLVVCRVLDFSAAGLAELVVWGEHERFRSRLASIVALGDRRWLLRCPRWIRKPRFRFVLDKRKNRLEQLERRLRRYLSIFDLRIPLLYNDRSPPETNWKLQIRQPPSITLLSRIINLLRKCRAAIGTASGRSQ